MLANLILCVGQFFFTFYKQLLVTKIPKVQKDTDDLTVFFHFYTKKLLVKHL